MKRWVWLALLLPLVLTARVTTEFYVDHDYIGTPRDGTAAHPWRSLADTVTNNPWGQINSTLGSGPVTVYFSAREASSDTSDVCCDVTLNRTDTSTNRLTLDGMSKWNQNDTTPSWTDYVGSPTRDTPKAQLYNEVGNGWAMGWGTGGIIPAMDYMTLRGFETTGSRARVRLEGGGSHMVVEYFYVHDVTTGGPGMTFNAGAYAYSSGPTDLNPSAPCVLRVSHLSTDVVFRYNHINNTADEGLYFGGAGENGSGHGFNCLGHSDIHFIGNTISNAGVGVGEGDCFDLKNGNQNITYSGNIVGPCWRNGISPQGAAVSYQPQTLVIEGNVVHDTNTLGGTGAITLVNTWTTVPSSATIRNNIVYNGSITANDGDSNTDGNGAKHNISILNNTVDTGNVLMKYIQTGALFNNIILGSIDQSQTSSFTFDYNAINGTGNSGAHAISLTAGQVTALFVNRAARDYRLASNTVAAYNTGTNTNCPAVDYYGNSRPQFVTCDIGADEFTGSSPSAPSVSSLSTSSGPVGTPVQVNGANFASSQGTSSLTFNGTAATASSWSTTVINTSVPSGATTGPVVVTVGGMASNGINFTVTPGPPDTSGPVPGNGGKLTPAVTSTSMGITWTQATDDSSPQVTLQYEARVSSVNNLGSVAAIEQNGKVVKAYTPAAKGAAASGLAPNFRYCMNVIVKDQAGNKTAYVPVCARTLRRN